MNRFRYIWIADPWKYPFPPLVPWIEPGWEIIRIKTLINGEGVAIVDTNPTHKQQ